MKFVSELYNIHPGEDIYIIGTGPSLRVFPLSFLEGKITIGLNNAYKLVPVRYSITVHPDLYVPEFLEGEAPHPEMSWIAKYPKIKDLLSFEQFRYAAERFYFFESDGQPNTQPPQQPSNSGRILDWVRAPVDNKLYLWSSISQTAANLAANMGARNVVLVGCDLGALSGDHHAHEKPTRWKGARPAERYRQYYEGLAEVRAALRERGVNLVSLSPLLGFLNAEEDFRRLCAELGKPETLPPVNDRSPGVSPREYLRWWKNWPFYADPTRFLRR